MTAVEFTPGLELSRLFYLDAVKPILDETFPDLDYSAGLIGSGSEVLGYDDPQSTDHHWGPRLQLFVPEDVHGIYAPIIRPALAHKLPTTFNGYSTNFSEPNPADNGVQLLEPIAEGPVNHRVEVLTLEAFCREYLGIHPNTSLSPSDWLTIPGQKLLSIVEGGVFRDGSGRLTWLQEKLDYYPRDVWLMMLAAGWTRVGQEEAFMGRAGQVRDELGSRLIASRLVHDLMNLCFLMERQYPPYSKWFGSAFKKLTCAGTLTPLFQQVLDARQWQEREKPLAVAFEHVAQMHQDLAITKPLPGEVSHFHDRPYLVIHGELIAEAIRQQITDVEVARIIDLTHIGAVEQVTNSADILSYTRLCRKLQILYH